MKYKIKDLQGEGMKEGMLFGSKAEVIEHLADYHNNDWTDERYDHIYYLLKTLTAEEKLNFLCEYGSWEVLPDLNNDTQIMHHLWWLYKYLDRDFKGKEYKDIISTELETEVIKELEQLKGVS